MPVNNSLRKYYHTCTECSTMTYYCPTDKESNGLKVIPNGATLKEKRKIYTARHRDKKLKLKLDAIESNDSPNVDPIIEKN